MVIEELCDIVRRDLPLRARLVGRERLDDIVRMAVQEWPCDRLYSASLWDKEMENLRGSVSRTYEAVHGGDRRYGFLWQFVIGAVISAILERILEWWAQSIVHREQVIAWSRSQKGRS
jgi:hypothetical protein